MKSSTNAKQRPLSREELTEWANFLYGRYVKLKKLQPTNKTKIIVKDTNYDKLSS